MALILAVLALAASPVARCHTADLRVTLGPIQVGTTNVGTEVAFRNVSGRACRVYGYAGFGLEDAHHRPQRSHLRWGNTYFRTDPRPHRVVLQPGRAAFAVLAWTDNPAPDERTSACEPVSAWLEVTPPDERTFRRVRFGERACYHGNLVATALSARR